MCAAAGDGRLEYVKWLHEQGGADINRGNHDDRTPLHFACKAGHLEVSEQHLKSRQGEVIYGPKFVQAITELLTTGYNSLQVFCVMTCSCSLVIPDQSITPIYAC